MPEDGKHGVATSVIVFDDQRRVLLMKRRDHQNWEPPGGVLKVGESPQDGARREVLEETGVEAEVGPLVGVYDNVNHEVITLVFRGRVRNDAQAKTDEAVAVRWVRAEDVESFLNDDYTQWIEDALSGGPAPVRTQSETIKGASAT
jgi:8-oxo-dGTP diphosphatase